MRWLGSAAAFAVVSGIGLATFGLISPPHATPPVPRVAEHQRESPTPGTSSRPVAAERPTVVASPPVSIAIPALGITSALGPQRGLTATGTIDDAPLSGPTWALPWWYDDGPTPGEEGSAVILGHVDSAIGAGHLGVFFTLGNLRTGQAITVDLADGTVTRWVVTSVVLYPDTQFPDALVYAHSGSPVLRLVTCGGTFDPQTHGYESATVVTATPAGSS